MNILLDYIPQTASTSMDFATPVMVILITVAFLVAWAINRISILRIRKTSEKTKDISAIMQHTLSLGGNVVLRLDIRRQHAYNLHGNLLPEEGLGYEESFGNIHPDDRHIYRDFIMRMIRGDERMADCIFRWDVSRDHIGEWRYMHDQGIAEFRGNNQRPVNIFCTLTDCTEQVMQEKETSNMTERYRKIFDQSIVGLAFYDKDGNLITANHKMQELLKFQSEDDPFYYGQTIYDMPTFREVLNYSHIEELYFCTKSVIIERGVNCYTEMRVHPIYDAQGELIYITFSIRDITQERELYLKNKENAEMIRRTNQDIQQYENEIRYLMETCDMRFWRSSFINNDITFYKGLSAPERHLTFEEFKNCFVDDDGTVAHNFSDPKKYFNVSTVYLCHTRPLFHEGDQLQWNFIDSVPNFDDNGQLIGCYGVIRNVTDLVKKQELLRQETERANDSGRMKSVFMANMTHEIRTPLNSIVGFSDVLPMLTTPEEKQEIVRVIMNNCDMLLRLVNDILAVSALDAGGIQIKPAKTDFAKDFDDFCKSLSQRVEEPTVEFIADNPYPSFMTEVDKERLQQVLTNFVTNAVKYTHQGHIRVGYDYRDGGLYIYCEDTGAGIQKEDQQKIFDRFVKLNDYVQGTGLGLNISKAIAESCHGKIGVDSEGDGKGSTFWLWIPCEKIETENCE